MPFNMAVASGGRRTFILSITASELNGYDIEAKLVAKFPSATPSRAGDNIQLNIGNFTVAANSTSGYAIDGDGLHNLAILTIDFTAGALVNGKGGAGGEGGFGGWEPESPGFDLSTVGLPGSNGGTAIRLGCETNFTGNGIIRKGFGGGGGGGGGATGVSDQFGGGGGGGGAAYGDGGAGGSGSSGTGVAGTAATNIVAGDGGAAGGSSAGAGGKGGVITLAAAAGSNGTKSGGAAGTDGNAINTQGFTYTAEFGITIDGAII